MNTLHENTRAALSALIKSSETEEELHLMAKRIVRHYNNATISAGHLRQLDGMIVTRLCLLENHSEVMKIAFGTHGQG